MALPRLACQPCMLTGVDAKDAVRFLRVLAELERCGREHRERRDEMIRELRDGLARDVRQSLLRLADPWLGVHLLLPTARAKGAPDELVGILVAAARAAGWSWASIAEALGVTRQGAHQRFAEYE